MSLSNPVISNKRPVDWYVQWNGGMNKGYFSRYEKSSTQGQKGTNIEVDLKNMIVLDQNMFSLTGFRERDEAGIQSNEVRSTFLDPKAVLEVYAWVKGKKELVRKGTYTELKDWVKDTQWVNYTGCIYGYLPDVDKVIHLQLSGIAFGQWGKIEGAGTHDSHYISHIKTEEGKKGAIEFKYPVFAYGDKFKTDHFNKAIEHDKKVQAYLTAYLGGTLVEETHDDVNQETHHEETTQEQAPAFDTKQWRELEYESGKFLGQLTRPEIRALEEKLVSGGTSEGVLIDSIGQAIHDYQQIEKDETWKQLKDKSGRFLTDYNLEELQQAFNKVPYNKEAKIKIELAIEATKAAEKSAGLPTDGGSDWD